MYSGWCEMVAEQEGDVIEGDLGRAADRLAAKGLFGPGDRLSMRVPETQAFVVLRFADAAGAKCYDWGRLADAAHGLHDRVYAERPDVGAIFSGGLPWSSALCALDLTMPAVFDEQVRHLGLEARRLAIGAEADAPLPALGNGANAFLLDEGALCLGMGLERLLQNIEILEKCAQSFALATAVAGAVRRIPWLVRFVANGRLRKDQRDAAARHRRGERSVQKAGY
jgi:hypothetical protein